MYWLPRSLNAGSCAFLLVIIAISGLSACGGDPALTTEQYIARAKDYQDKGEMQSAIIELKNALQHSPDSIEARWLIGRIHLRQGDGAAAEKELRRAVANGLAPAAAEVPLTRALLLQRMNQAVIDSPVDANTLPALERAELLALRANAYLAMGEQGKAETLYTAALAIRPDQPEALTGKAALALAQNRIGDARRDLATIFESAPDYAPAWSLLGYVDFTDKQYAKAEEAFTRSMEDPVFRDGNRFIRALVRIKLKNYEAAAADISALRQRYQRSSDVDYAEGLLAFDQGRYEDAQRSFDAVLGAVHNHQPALFYAGVTHMILGHPESAENALRRHLSLNPANLMAVKLLAQIELNTGDPAQAELQARSVLQQAPEDVTAMNLLASALSIQGDQTAAVGSLQQVVALQPESAAARVLLGSALLRQGNIEAGLDELERTLALDPQSYQAVDRLVRAHLQAGDDARALELAIEYRDRQPDVAPAHVLLGVVYMKKNALQEAAQAFQQAIATDPRYPPSYHGLAVISIREKQFDKAEEYYRSALRQRPGDPQTLMNLASLKGMQGDTSARMALLQNAIDSNPKALEPRLALARMLLGSGAAERALNSLDKMHSQYPQDKNLLGVTAQCELATGRYAEAQATLTRLAELSPADAQVPFHLAAAYEGLKEQDKMRAALERALALDPDYVAAHIVMARLDLREQRIGAAEPRITEIGKRVSSDNPQRISLEAQLLALKGDLQGAAGKYRQLYALEPNSLNLRRSARAQWDAGDKDSAVADAEAWLQQHPDDTAVQMELAQRYLLLERPGDAIARYRTVIGAHPDNVLALNNLASLLRESEPAAALGYAERAYALAAESPAVMDTLAAALLGTGDTQRATRMIERALAKQPANTSFRYRRAQILAASGQPAAAMQVIKEILELGREFPEQAEAEALLKQLRSGS